LTPTPNQASCRNFLIGLLGLLALVGVATVLRLHDLDRWSLWLDELLQYKESAAPFNTLQSSLFAQDMPISYMLGHVFVAAGFDNNEWQLRFPFAMFGVATVVMIYLLARELLGQRAAILSGLVACLMPVLVAYSQEYRAYSILIFLMTLSGWSLAVALRTNRAGWWALFVAAAILNLYTHFVAMLNLVGLGAFVLCYLLLRLWRGQPIGPVMWSSFLAFAIIAVAFVPALPMLARLTKAEAIFLHPVSTLDRLRWIGFLVLDNPGYVYPTRYLLAGFAAIGVICTGYRSPRALLFILSTFGVPALLYAFFGYERASASPRYTLPLMAPLILAVGEGLGAFSYGVEALAARLPHGSRYAGPVSAGIVALALVAASLPSLVSLYNANPKQLPVDVREGFSYVRSKADANDLLLGANINEGGTVYWFPSYEAYYLREGLWPNTPVHGIVDDQTFPRRLVRYLDQQGRLWVIIVVSDQQQPALQERNSDDFGVKCFRQICVIQSRHAERPMLEQLGAFFDRFADLDPNYFAASARAVRTRLDADRGGK
jgi:Dolichyl-phosphate-mannose-protein mannosyltransferase